MAFAAAFDPTAYRRVLHARLPAFLPPASCPSSVREVLDAPSRRVTVGAGRETWTEHAIAGTALRAALESDEVFDLATAGAAVPLVRPPLVWAQSYVTGEKISWHCDGDGTIQLLLCLEAPPAENGGSFRMRLAEGDIHLVLRAGDALLFKASAIPHCTTRLVAGPRMAAVRRVTAVARFCEARG